MTPHPLYWSATGHLLPTWLNLFSFENQGVESSREFPGHSWLLFICISPVGNIVETSPFSILKKLYKFIFTPFNNMISRLFNCKTNTTQQLICNCVFLNSLQTTCVKTKLKPVTILCYKRIILGTIGNHGTEDTYV